MSDNPKVSTKNTRHQGKGVFVKERITKGEVIAVFDGNIYDHKSIWTDELRNHCIQFERKKWRDSTGIARLINHSCEPNCGIKDSFSVVAMRDIEKGEEITWGYEMTEDNLYWRMDCSCGSLSCRKVIGAYKNMPLATRRKYKGYISKWLLEEYA